MPDSLRNTLAEAGLTEREEEAVVLVHEQGLSQEEAGKRLRIQANTVQDHLQRAHRKIRTHFWRQRHREQRRTALETGLEDLRETDE